MLPTQSIEIGGKRYPIKYGYRATKYLGQIWNVPGLMEVYQRVIDIIPKSVAESQGKKDVKDVDLETINTADPELTNALLSFDSIDTMIDVAAAGIYGAIGKNETPPEIDEDEIQGVLFSDPSVITLIFQKFIESMPMGKGSASPEPVEPGKKKKETPRRKK